MTFCSDDRRFRPSEPREASTNRRLTDEIQWAQVAGTCDFGVIGGSEVAIRMDPRKVGSSILLWNSGWLGVIRANDGHVGWCRAEPSWVDGAA